MCLCGDREKKNVGRSLVGDELPCGFFDGKSWKNLWRELDGRL
jgi:hypothetical protein